MSIMTDTLIELADTLSNEARHLAACERRIQFGYGDAITEAIVTGSRERLEDLAQRIRCRLNRG